MTTGIFSRVFACTPGDSAYPTHSPPAAGRSCRRSRQWEAGGLGRRTCPRASVPTITPHTPSPLVKIRFAWHTPSPLVKIRFAWHTPSPLMKIRFAWHTPSPLDLYVRSSPSLVPRARPAIARTHPDTPPDGDAGRDARGPDALRSATSTSERREALGRDARGPDALMENHRLEGFRTGGTTRDRQETRGQRRVHEPGGGG